MQLLKDNNNLEKRNPGVSAAVLMCVLLAYSITRFIFHPALYLFLALFLFLYLKSFFKNSTRGTGVLIMAPMLFLAALASLGCYAYGDVAHGNYYLFSTLIFFCLASSPRMFFFNEPATVRWLGIVFCVAVIPFLIFPDLKNYGSYEVSADDIRNSLYRETAEDRVQAFFYHPNEFAIFGVALFILQLSVIQQNGRSFVFKFIDRSLKAFTLLCIAVSGSATAFFIVPLAIYYRYFKRTFFKIGALLIFVFLSFGQLVFPHQVSAAIGHGSFYWRFDVADRVMHMKPQWLDYSPTFMAHANLETWPHSMILDYVLTYGYLAGFIPLLTLICAAFSKKLEPYVGWLAIFFSAVAVQPMGAMPVPYLALAVSVGALLAIDRSVFSKAAPSDLTFRPKSKLLDLQ